MSELTKQSESNSSNGVIEHLSGIIHDYIVKDPSTRSINSLSKKCLMSEATLRRIYKKQIKFTPNISTLLDILTKIGGTSSLLEISKMFEGPVAEHLRCTLPDSNFVEINYDPNLNNEFENSTKYLLYKLSSNNTGVTKQKVEKLFGSSGLYLAQELVETGFVSLKEDVFKSTKKHFQSDQNSFNRNFKSVSNFIKPYTPGSVQAVSSVRVNYSESVSEKTYKEIISIQKKAIMKIRDLMADKNNCGSVPAFMLVGVDTLDEKSFDELCNEKKRSGL